MYVEKISRILHPNIDHPYDYLWMGGIYRVAFAITIAVTKTHHEEIRGLLLTHLRSDPHDYWARHKEIGPGTFTILKDWHDPVYDALQSINVLPNQDRIVFGDDPREFFYFDLGVFSRKCNAFLHYGGGPIEDKSIATLWESLRQAIHDIAQAYNHPELTKYITDMWQE
jgi:hypothetical protein